MSPSNFESKLPAVGTTIFTVMSQMAAAHNAINLSQGFPDFEIDPKLSELVDFYMRDGKNQYAPMAGLSVLRERIADKINKSYGCKVSADDNVTITAGATEALYAAITALVRPGDEVIVLEPAYDSYVPAIELNGAKPVFVQLNSSDFSIDWNAVETAITAKTRMLIVNSPHNPSGAIIGAQDLTELGRLAKKHNLIVLSDEVYEHIIFDQSDHQSALRNSDLFSCCVAVFSFGKTFHATGWKVGYCVAPDWITKEIRKVHQYLTFSVNTPTQYALADYLAEEAHYLDLGTFYQEKRDLFLDLTKKSRLEPIESKGTYFQLMSYKSVSDKLEVEMAELLAKEHGLASIPISVFYSENIENQVLRFCFAKNNDTLKKAAEILCKI